MGAGSARGPGNEAAYITQNSCAPSSARTTSTTAPAFDTLHRLPDSVSPSVKVPCLFSVPELEDAEVIFDIGYNAPVSHPLVARHIVRAKKKGCKHHLRSSAPDRNGRIATIYLPIKGGTNMLFLNAMAHVMVTEDLVDHDFIEKHTTALSTMPKKWPRINTRLKLSPQRPNPS